MPVASIHVISVGSTQYDLRQAVMWVLISATKLRVTYRGAPQGTWVTHDLVGWITAKQASLGTPIALCPHIFSNGSSFYDVRFAAMWFPSGAGVKVYYEGAPEGTWVEHPSWILWDAKKQASLATEIAAAHVLTVGSTRYDVNQAVMWSLVSPTELRVNYRGTPQETWISHDLPTWIAAKQTALRSTIAQSPHIFSNGSSFYDLRFASMWFPVGDGVRVYYEGTPEGTWVEHPSLTAWEPQKQTSMSLDDIGDLVRALLVEAQIAIPAGRAGANTVTTVSAGRTSVKDGRALAANEADVIDLNIAGINVPMFGVWGARTNSFLNSGDFSNASWTKQTCSVATKAGEFPGAYAVTESADADNTYHVVKPVTSITVTGTPTILSVYAKASGRAGLSLQIGISSCVFDLTTGNVINIGGITAAGSSPVAGYPGWRRYWVYMAAPLSNASFIFPATTTSYYIGDGREAILIAAAQLESGPIATSYIPTAGSAVAVTGPFNQHVFTPSDGISGVAGEIFCIYAPYLWGAAAGGVTPHVGGYATIANILGGGDEVIDYLTRENAASTRKRSNGISYFAQITSPAESTGALRTASQLWSGNTVSRYGDGVVSPPTTIPTPPFVTRATINVGCSGGTSTLQGLVGCFYLPRVMTTVERAALRSMMPTSIAFGA